MPVYRSTLTGRAVWPDLTAPDGSTLELDPGETVELPTKITAPGLELVAAEKPAAKPASSATKQ